ncbi:MAG: glycosyltransferase family 4 protein [Endomicrobiales bacterium]|nr:glycosyltransferase family 4 protein [Endomicrobiales bacterium]
MRKIKVCHIITQLELGGAQLATLHTVSKLNKDIFEVSLISGIGGILDETAKQIPDIKNYFVKELVRQISPLNDIICTYKLWRLLKFIKPEVVHTNSSKAGILGRIAAKLACVPVTIHTFHGFGFNDYEGKLKKTIFLMSEKLIAPITDKFIAVSNDNISTAIAKHIGKKDKYVLIRCGIKTSRYFENKADVEALKKSLNIPANKSVITTIGPFKPQKNLLDYIRVASEVLWKNANCIFLVVGDGKGRCELEMEIKALALENKVLLLGWRKDIPDILAMTNIFVMTSLWEGLPRTILEAMCSSKPVVANAVDGVREIVYEGETGFQITPRDVSTMAEKILYLLNNAEVALRFGQSARNKMTKEFDIDYMVIQQEQLYKGLTSTL